MKYINHKIHFLVLLSFFWTVGFSNIKNIGIPFIRNYNLSGIPAGAQTWMIETGANGLVYFANNDGVLEFDGRRWKKYPLPEGRVVRSVKATDDGRIFAGAFNEIGYFIHDIATGMVYQSLNHLLPDEFSDYGEVWKIYETSVGIIFQAFEQIMIYDGTKISVIAASGMFHFSFLVNGELYVNDQIEGLYRLAGERLIKVPGAQPLKGQLIWSMLPKGDNILIATADNGIFEFDGLNLIEWKNPAAGQLQNYQVYFGMSLSDEKYAFGTIQNGLIICDIQGNIIQHINLDKGLQNNTVLSISRDKYNNLWLGLDTGIDYVEINSPLTFFSNYNSLSAGYTAILHDGLLYFGTNRGLFYHDWEKLIAGGSSQKFDLVPGTQGQVWDLKIFGETLFCGHNSGVFLIEGGKARQLSDVQGGWTFLQPNNNDDLILCGTYNGIVKFDRISGAWQEGLRVSGFKESSRFLAQGGKNSIWMSHGYKGVFRLEFDENFTKVINVDFYDAAKGFPSSKNINVFTLFNQPVFTTDEGLYKFREATDTFIPDTKTNNLFPNQKIRFLKPDDAGNIWYFTMENAGVFRLQEDGAYVNVDLPFRELNGRFINWFQFVYPLSSEHVFFGTQNGFVHYTPEYPKNYRKPFGAIIRKIELAGADSLIFPNASDNESFTFGLPFRNNQLQFEFAATDFENPQALRFSTFLEGFDSDWTAWQSRNFREYTNLSPGNYTFRVKAINIFDNESAPASIGFEIFPPWYLDWHGYLLYAASLALIVLLLARYVRFRMEKSKKQEEERQKRIFSEREKQLKTEALESEKEVIRLRNEKLREEMKQKDKELANSTMQMIQKSKMLRSIKRDIRKLAGDIGDDIITNHINKITRQIDREIDTDQQWEVFEKHFENVYEEFLKRLKAKYPDLTPREMKLCAYLRLNISSKEIATLMNISTRGVEISRYRLRKKLNLDHDINLTEFIMGF
jgi:DNA-binding CsgD family transcriptional regulator